MTYISDIIDMLPKVDASGKWEEMNTDPKCSGSFKVCFLTYSLNFTVHEAYYDYSTGWEREQFNQGKPLAWWKDDWQMMLDEREQKMETDDEREESLG